MSLKVDWFKIEVCLLETGAVVERSSGRLFKALCKYTFAYVDSYFNMSLSFYDL